MEESDSLAEEKKFQENSVSKKVFVQNIGKKATLRQIRTFFEKFGQVTDVRRGHKSQTTAFITFCKEEAVRKALNATSDQLVFQKRKLSLQNSGVGKKKDLEENAPGGLAAINGLPETVIEYIFSFLNVKDLIRCESVCKRWREILETQPYCWPTELFLGGQLNMDLPDLTDETFSKILSKCGCRLKMLSISSENGKLKRLTSKAIVFIGKYCRNLHEFKITGFPLLKADTSAWDLISIAEGCPKLQYVSIINANVTDECLSIFLKKVTLEGLFLTKNPMLGRCLCNLNRNLKQLCLDECPNLQANIALPCLINQCENIEQLSLNFTCYDMDSDLLNRLLARYKDTLKILRLDGHIFQSDEWIEALSHLKVIEQLSLNQCDGINNNVLKAISVNCAKLWVLKVISSDITDTGIAFLASAQSLTVLAISNTKKVVGKGIAKLAEQGKLEELHVRGITRGKNFVQQSCVVIAKCCPNFRVLDLMLTENLDHTLVHEFCSSANKGFFKHPVYIYAAWTNIPIATNTNDRVRIIWKIPGIHF